MYYSPYWNSVSHYGTESTENLRGGRPAGRILASRQGGVRDPVHREQGGEAARGRARPPASGPAWPQEPHDGCGRDRLPPGYPAAGGACRPAGGARGAARIEARRAAAWAAADRV